MSDSIRPSLLRGRRTWDFKKLDNSWRKNTDASLAERVYRDQLRMKSAIVQHYVEKFIPQELQDRFYDVLEDYAHSHDLIAIMEMRRAVKGNGFAGANDAKAEDGDAAAAITIGVAARYPGLSMKDLLPKIEEAREKELGTKHRRIDRSTVHRHLGRVGESRRKRR